MTTIPVSVPGGVRLLAVGHGGTNGGFARVLREILTPLARDCEVLHLAIGAAAAAGVPYPTVTAPERDVYGINALPSVLAAFAPHAVLILHDPWAAPLYLECVARHAPGTPTIFYCPVDGPLLCPDVGKIIEAATVVVAYTRFGRDELARATARTLGRDAAYWRARIPVIPHGVDHATFRPLRDRAAARKAVSRWLDLDDEDFIVLNANRNQPRKDIPATIEGFARFAVGTPATVRLVLHMQSSGPFCDVRAMAARHGVADRIVLPRGREHPSVTDQELNLLYNAADVGVNTASAEGWGLVSFEHAAAGVPQLVPGHAACRELWAGHAELLACEPARPREGGFSADRPVCPPAVAAALSRVYRDAGHRARLGHLARARAGAPGLSWSRIAATWHELVVRVASGLPATGRP
jgi:glycosyltransferase involved in cell wall biosynthesis